MKVSSVFTSRHLVDPDLFELLELFPSGDLTAKTLPLARATTLPIDVDLAAAAAEARVSEQSVPARADAPAVPLRVYVPVSRTPSMPCICHIHGGGYVAGDAAEFESLHRQLSVLTGTVIVSVNYRLAPETKFRGAIEDCYAALDWIHQQAEVLGVDRSRLGVMGESAGGGLAAALSLLARDRGEYPVRFQHLIYPMLDDRTGQRDTGRTVGEFAWTPPHNSFGRRSLLPVPPGAAHVSPYAAPARACDLSRLPRTFISTAALDLFLEENIDDARRLALAGVALAGAHHAFDSTPRAAGARRARHDNLAALRRALQ
jgi:triacylglycerol lipase